MRKTVYFEQCPPEAGNCPKNLCTAGVPAGKKKLQRRALPARRRRYKAQMHPFSEFWDSLAGVTNPNRIAFLPTFMTHTLSFLKMEMDAGKALRVLGALPALEKKLSQDYNRISEKEMHGICRGRCSKIH